MGIESGTSFRLDILSAPNDGLNPSLILTVKKVIESQYLFNVPEGFARFVLEHKLRPGLGLRGVFLTGVGHECHGLPGLIMRLRGDGHGAFELFGPPSSLEYVQALPNVCSWKNPAIMVNQNPMEDVYEDENVIIRGILDAQNVEAGIGVDFLQHSDYDRSTILDQLGHLCPFPDTNAHTIFGRSYIKLCSVRHGNVWVKQAAQQSKPVQGEKCPAILGYICRIKSIKQNILISGYLDDFVMQTGAIMRHPSVSTCVDRPVFIMSSSFETSTESCAVYGDRVKDNTFVHLNLLGKMSDGCADLGFDSTAKVLSRLHNVCPYLFPLPHCWKYLKETPDDSKSKHRVEAHLAFGISGPFNGAFQLHAYGKRLVIVPYVSETCIHSLEALRGNQQKVELLNNLDKLKLLQERVQRCMVQNSSKEAGEASNMSAASALRQNLLCSRKRKLEVTPNDCSYKMDHKTNHLFDPYVLFLGTGSAEPSKYRGPSGILIKIPFIKRDEYILLECGEGTFGQLVRMFGYLGAMEKVARIRFVWISHRHADHMSGLVELLCHRASCETVSKLLVLGPRACVQWIKSLKKVIDFGKIDLEHIMGMPSSSACHNMQESISASIRCTTVQHCADAYAISIYFSNRFKLVYSGDTEPCQSLVDIGQGADLLIHEATFDPDMIQDARKKKHSTIEEAIHIAEKMNAKRTILTHFSQRYPKFPKGVPLNCSGLDTTLSIAFDGYCLPWPLLDEYHKFMPYFRDLLE